MKVAIIALTKGGKGLAYKLKEKLGRGDIYLPSKLGGEDIFSFDSSLKELVEEVFEKYEGIVFIMALGIVVRVIAPYLKDKRSDPAVVTLDQKGQNVISTLSGHLGGANGLTHQIADLLGANPVITTATDCQGCLAIDILAQELNCEIVPFENLKLANGAIVNGETLNIFTHYKLDRDFDEGINLFPLEDLGKIEGFPVVISNRQLDLSEDYLQLIPKNIVVGLGARRGVGAHSVEELIYSSLDYLGLRVESIKALVTVDLKKDEEGILEVASKLKLPLEIVSCDQIRGCDFEYTRSDFVEKKIGVGGVCEPVAMLRAKDPKLILPKKIGEGVTIAVVEESFM